ncbi:hypothetical protein [Providencia sp.]|uniref:hypothetical protein n=1 Tax=Providencia sp. TaxID=589 RepID=UPI0035B372BB
MLKSLLKVISSNILIQLIGVLSFPILVLVYTVEDISYLGTFIAYITILSIICSFRAENNLFIIKSIRQCESLAYFLYALSIIIGFILLILLSIASQFLDLADDLIYKLSVFGGVCYAIFNIKYNLLVRNKKENQFIRLKIIRMSLELLAIFLAYLLSFDISIYITLLCLTYLIPSLKKERISKSILLFFAGFNVFKNKISNVKYDFPASLLSVLTIYFPILYFFIIDEKIFSGIYFLLNRFIGAPSLLIAQSFNITLKQYATHEFLTRKSCSHTVNNAANLLLIKMLPLYILSGIAVAVFYKFYLSIYMQETALFFLIVLPIFITRFFFNCFSSIIYVMGLFKTNLTFQCIALFTSTLTLITPMEMETKILYFSFFVSLYYITYTLYILLLGNKEFN